MHRLTFSVLVEDEPKVPDIQAMLQDLVRDLLYERGVQTSHEMATVEPVIIS